MILSELLKELGLECPFGETEITSVTDKKENVVPGSLFVAVEGRNADGHMFVREAFECGAAAAVLARSAGCEKEIIVRDTRKAFSFLCSAFYGHPERRLSVIGITGTNGKTTVAEYLKTILERTGHKCGVIGTLGSGTDDERTDNGYTTPPGDKFFEILKEMADNDCEYCVAEISSQALSQSRVDAVTFSVGILTNIGTDHIDYHGKFSEYVSAKSRLFKLSEAALLNSDDAYCEQIAESAGNIPYMSYGAKGVYSDLMAKNIRYSADGISFIAIRGEDIAEIKLPLICEYSVYNVLAALGGAMLVGIGLDDAVRALSPLPVIKGRMQKIKQAGITVYVDFAHTPEALNGVLKSLSRIKSGRLITVFGCGGCRDKKKRPEMGRIASQYSDAVIITSDNPRDEDPEEIIKNITAGIKNKSTVFIRPDRMKAIELAVNKANKGDMILIAGKGHEEYQICSGKRTYFSDEAAVRRLLCTDL